MKSLFLLLFSLFLAQIGHTQQMIIPNTVVEDETIFEIVEQMPVFPGGQTEMLKFIHKNQRYTDIALKEKIEGTVIVEFIVEKDGSLSNIKVLKDIGGGCGDEAVRIVKIMPKWECGRQRDIPVRCKMRIPVKFKLAK
jgi:periplasmic protein TonB